MSATPPPTTGAPFTTARAWRLLLAALAGVVGLAALSLLLPDPAYLRSQLSAHTIQFHSRWIYERIHDDPTPIDVAVVGTSRAQDGVSPVVLQDELSRRLGRPIHVADFGMVEKGRNLHYAIVKDLLATRPEVKLVIVQVEGTAPWGHPLFRYLADDWDVIRSPMVIGNTYFTDLLYLPMRHILCFSESLFPHLFGVQASFQPSAYPSPGVDWTRGYVDFDGSFHNNMGTAAPKLLRIQAAHAEPGYMRLLKKVVPRSIQTAIEHKFTHDIVRLAHAHGAAVAFVDIPAFENLDPIEDPGFYASQGPFFRALQVVNQPTLYSGGPHLNHTGAALVSNWLALKMAPLLAARASGDGGVKPPNTTAPPAA